MHTFVDLVIGVVAVLIVGGALWFVSVRNSKAVDEEIDFYREHEELMRKAEERTKNLRALLKGPDDGDDLPPGFKRPLPPPPS